MIIASLSITLGGSLTVLILLLVVMVGVAILFYRFTLPPLPTRRRIVLSTLRALALSLMLLIFFEPVLRLVKSDEQAPVVAVLMDNSQSMTIRDGAGDRAAATRKFFHDNHLSQLPQNARIKYFPFSSQLQPASSAAPDSLPLSGETTNLSAVLKQLKDQLNRENIQTAVLISDGNYTAGKNPLYDAEALGIPLYTIGVGDTTEQKDVLIQKVITNNLAYADSRVPVDVTIKSTGYNNINAEVSIAEGQSVLDRKVVSLKEGVHEYPVRLFAEPKEEGTKKYTISVSNLAGELTERNNSHSVFIKVLKSKLRVVILAGAANPDVAIIRQTLVEDEHLALKSFVQKDVNSFYEGLLNRPTLDSADCFVLIGFPGASTNGASLKLVADVVEQDYKPVLFINSRTTDYGKLQSLEPMLPFSWSGASTAEVLVFPSIPERQKNHPLVMLEGNASVDSWQGLPPIYKTQTLFRAKAEADVLALVKMQNVVLNEPLIAVRNINRRKSFAITGHAVWRWRLLAQENVQTERLFSLLMTNAVRWLTTKEDDKNVRVVPVKEIFTTAEPLEFTGQVYDEQLHPVDNAELRVELNHGKEKFQIALNAVGNGRYEGSFDGAGEGDYTFVGKATADGRTYGEDRGKFSIGQLNVEFLETKMNKQLMEQLAFQTGGKYYDIAASGALETDLPRSTKFVSKEIIQTSEIELWNWKYLAATVILLLALEWFLRKRSGML